MKRIYLDNGATSFPKAPGVSDSMSRYILNVGTNIGRGAYSEAFEAHDIIHEAREKIAALFKFQHPTHVVFTKNITESMNILLKGLLGPNDHVIVSPLEHNAVMRPLRSLEKKGLTFSRAACDLNGNLILESIYPLIQANTKAIIMTHCSNVCGTILDLTSVGKIAKENNLLFIIDAAQTAGIIDINFKTLNADAIAFTGHKALLGPQGTGGFVIDPKLVGRVNPLIEGGTGSASDSEDQPEYMPDKFESGTPNTVGLFGLHTSLSYIEKTGLQRLQTVELNHTGTFIEGIRHLPNIRLIGRSDLNWRTAVVSLDFINQDNADIAWRLEKEFGISVRVGMHCAPSAHKSLGTFPQGTVRFSFSPFTTTDEITTAIHAVESLSSDIC